MKKNVYLHMIVLMFIHLHFIDYKKGIKSQKFEIK